MCVVIENSFAVVDKSNFKTRKNKYYFNPSTMCEIYLNLI